MSAADEPDHYQQVADAIEMAALDPALIEVTVVQDGRVLDHDPGMYVLARCLDKAGLIDHRALR